MRLRLRRPRARTEPPTEPFAVQSAALSWHPADQLPDVGTLIEFEWLGQLFTGRFQQTLPPWGMAWLVYLSYPRASLESQWISSAHISRWRYL